MVSDRMLTFISRRLSEIYGNVAPFGGFKIILFRDFFELRPVYGLYAFKNRLLWDLFRPIMLRENVRQWSDPQYVNLLNRARVGMLNSEDIRFLKIRLISPETKSAHLHIFPTRSAVKLHNDEC